MVNISFPRIKQKYLISLLALTVIILSVGNYLRWWNLNTYVGPLLLHHWLGWVGAMYIAIITPLYSILKRRYPGRMKTLLAVHVFGNLIAFLFISIHFTQLMGRPALFAPIPGTGMAQYIIVATMVATGLMQRLRLAKGFLKPWRFIHVSLSLSYYIVLTVHILRNLGVI